MVLAHISDHVWTLPHPEPGIVSPVIADYSYIEISPIYGLNGDTLVNNILVLVYIIRP